LTQLAERDSSVANGRTNTAMGHHDSELLGEWLRESRIGAGLTQESLAERSGLSVRTISNLERGVSERPYPRSIRLLAEALGAPSGVTDEMTAQVHRRAAAARFGGWLPQGANIAITAAQVASTRFLPPGVQPFTGRAEEVALLATQLQDDDRPKGSVLISAISGTAGAGKSALALHWGHQIADQFPDGQLFAGLRGFDPCCPPVEPIEVLGDLLTALGTPPPMMPPTLSGRSGLYRSLLAEKRMLIVLDDAYDEAQVRPLLPGSSGCLVIVTSRNTLSGLAASHSAQLVPLGVFSEADAYQMLATRLGDIRAASEQTAVATIISLCAQLPLALAITAARAAANPHLPLAALATELEEARHRLDVLEAGDAATSVRAAFTCSYRKLTKRAKRMFCLLGRHPGPDISIPAAASLAGAAFDDARSRLQELARQNLLTEHSPGRYTCHDLLRSYAAEQASTESEASLRDAALRVLDHYLQTAYTASLLLNPGRDPIAIAPTGPGVMPEPLGDLQDALDWFEAEHHVLLSVVSMAAAAGHDTFAWQIPWAMSNYLDWRGHWPEWAVVQRFALTAATRLGDPAAQALAKLILGQISARSGDYDHAREHLMDSLASYQELGDSRGEAQVHMILSYVAGQQGRRREALELAEQALTLYRATQTAAGQAAALNDIGWSYAFLGDYRRARTSCRRALVLHRMLGDLRCEAKTWDSLGYIEHRLGRHAEATHCYQRALRISREVGDRFGEAEYLLHIGDAQQGVGSLPDARRSWQRSLHILDELHHPRANQIRNKLQSVEAVLLTSLSARALPDPAGYGA
jgi:tetratricopeptide (TPR) repeat protein/transcriptional regulator with XRE-family HTH domain